MSVIIFICGRKSIVFEFELHHYGIQHVLKHIYTQTKRNKTAYAIGRCDSELDDIFEPIRVVLCVTIRTTEECGYIYLVELYATLR